MFKETQRGILLDVKLITGSSKEEIIGWENEILKIRVKGPREKGKANKALIKFLAKIFKVSSSNILILKGKTSTLKSLLIIDADFSKIAELLKNRLNS